MIRPPTTQGSRFLAAAATLLVTTIPGSAAYNYSGEDRATRWQDLHTRLFGARQLRDDAASVKLIAPDTALDAALVPVSIVLARPQEVRSLYLVVDDNPAPLAAHFDFGPAADARRVDLRVRVDHVTAMHAVAVMKDGSLVDASTLVKASGGCSAPTGASDEEAMAGMGDIKVKIAAHTVGEPIPATLMIRHPNFSGMQMNADLHVFTPPRYVKAVTVSLNGILVFKAVTDISVSANPVISFLLAPPIDKGDLEVVVEDSKGSEWSKGFAIGKE